MAGFRKKWWCAKWACVLAQQAPITRSRAKAGPWGSSGLGRRRWLGRGQGAEAGEDGYSELLKKNLQPLLGWNMQVCRGGQSEAPEGSGATERGNLNIILTHALTQCFSLLGPVRRKGLKNKTNRKSTVITETRWWRQWGRQATVPATGAPGRGGDHHRLDGHRQQPGHQAAALVLVKGSAHSDNINARTEGVNMKLLTF